MEKEEREELEKEKAEEDARISSKNAKKCCYLFRLLAIGVLPSLSLFALSLLVLSLLVQCPSALSLLEHRKRKKNRSHFAETRWPMKSGEAM